MATNVRSPDLFQNWAITTTLVRPLPITRYTWSTQGTSLLWSHVNLSAEEWSVAVLNTQRAWQSEAILVLSSPLHTGNILNSNLCLYVKCLPYRLCCVGPTAWGFCRGSQTQCEHCPTEIWLTRLFHCALWECARKKLTQHSEKYLLHLLFLAFRAKLPTLQASYIIKYKKPFWMLGLVVPNTSTLNTCMNATSIPLT